MTRWKALLTTTVWRRAALTALVVVSGVAAAFLGWAELTGLSFERTDASQFKVWAAQPVGTAGGIALCCCVLGLAAWFLSRRHGRLLALAGVLVIASGAVLVWGVVQHAARSHPEYDRARALQALELPVGYITGPIQLDHASDITAPAATRMWTTTLPVARVCSDLERQLATWADPGSVRRFGLTNIQRCYISASKDGHVVDTNVNAGTRQVTLSIRLAG